MQIKIFIRHWMRKLNKYKWGYNQYVTPYYTPAIIYPQSIDQKQFSIWVRRGYISSGQRRGMEGVGRWKIDSMSRDICETAELFLLRNYVVKLRYLNKCFREEKSDGAASSSRPMSSNSKKEARLSFSASIVSECMWVTLRVIIGKIILRASIHFASWQCSLEIFRDMNYEVTKCEKIK